MANTVKIAMTVDVQDAESGTSLLAETMAISNTTRVNALEDIAAWLQEFPMERLNDLSEDAYTQAPASTSVPDRLAALKPRVMLRLMLFEIGRQAQHAGKTRRVHQRVAAIREELDNIPVGDIEPVEPAE